MKPEFSEADAIALLEHIGSDPLVLGAASDAARNQGRAGKTLPQDEVSRHITAILAAVRAAATGDAAVLAEANAAVDDLAMDRLEQGISLEILLQGVRSARGVLLNRILELGPDILGTESLLSLLGPIDALVGAVHDRMILTYRAGERDLVRSRRTARIEALRELLGGGSPDWATEAGLEPRREYHCLVADVSIPREARRLEQLWTTSDAVSGIVHGYLCSITSELPRADLSAHLVVASPAVPVGDLAGAYALCRQALAHYRSEQATGLQSMLAAALEIAVAAQPLLGELLARQMLRELNPANEFHRELAATARAYVASGMRVEDAAASLHIHGNTLRYRMRRFNELTEAALAPLAPGQTLSFNLHAWWALTTWLATAEKTG